VADGDGRVFLVLEEEDGPKWKEAARGFSLEEEEEGGSPMPNELAILRLVRVVFLTVIDSDHVVDFSQERVRNLRRCVRYFIATISGRNLTDLMPLLPPNTKVSSASRSYPIPW